MQKPLCPQCCDRSFSQVDLTDCHSFELCFRFSFCLLCYCWDLATMKWKLLFIPGPLFSCTFLQGLPSLHLLCSCRRLINRQPIVSFAYLCEKFIPSPSERPLKRWLGCLDPFRTIVRLLRFFAVDYSIQPKPDCSAIVSSAGSCHIFKLPQC